MRTRHLVAAAVAALALVTPACSSGGDDDGGTATTTTVRASSDPVGSGAITDIADVEKAVIQVVATGSFVEPDGSLAASQTFEGSSSGSGFIIDPSGIAVTNNHVVTGAATLEVYVAGEDDPVSAKVLGVSECSDLAVIQLEGDDYPYLRWASEAPAVGVEVRAAGFPLGDPEYTLTSGIISKAEAAGDTNWASVESVVEHDANIQPGNSGGPLVNAETGEVVAVNYAGGDVGGTGTSQFFAISSELAQPLVDRLEEGDVDSLGVNGQAVYDPDSGVAGIWVASVDTNSPAGELGLQGGDIIEKIEGLSMGTDGTLADYCNVLGSREPTDKLAVQVLRYDEGVRLSGEFNGDELEPVESLAEQVEEETGGLSSGAAYGDFVPVSDDSGVISVMVPSQWSQVDGTPITLDDGSQVQNVQAAPDLQGFRERWDVPGLSLSAATAGQLGDSASLLDQFVSGAAGACTDGGREPYDDGLYTGQIQYFTNCGGTGAASAFIVAEPAGGGFVALVQVQMVTDADIDALDEIIATFTVAL